METEKKKKKHLRELKSKLRFYWDSSLQRCSLLGCIPTPSTAKPLPLSGQIQINQSGLSEYLMYIRYSVLLTSERRRNWTNWLGSFVCLCWCFTGQSTHWGHVEFSVLLLGRLSHLSGYPVLSTLLSPETDNCPSWISGRERMIVENISWSISTTECCRPGGGWTRNLLITSRTRIGQATEAGRGR